MKYLGQSSAIYLAFISSFMLLTTSGCGSNSATSDSADVTREQQPPTNEPVHTPVDIPEVSEHWQLVWADEFNQPEIDLSKWSFEVNCYGGGNNEQQCYTAREDNTYIEDGKLVIKAIRENFTGPAMLDDAPNYLTGGEKQLPYTSARLRSKGKGDWLYGRFEIRAQLPKGQGTWPAIWMLPTDWQYGSWPLSGEIDIMEAVNLTTRSDAANATANSIENRVHGTLHYGRKAPENIYTGMGYSLPNDVNPADDFHVYALEWQQGEIRWYVDGVHYATQTDAGWYSQYQDDNMVWQTQHQGAPFDQKFHLLLNFAVGGNWAANVNEKGIDESVFPQRLLVDYVRVYECSIAPNSGAGCAAIGSDAIAVSGRQPPKS